MAYATYRYNKPVEYANGKVTNPVMGAIDAGKPGYFPASGWQFTRAFMFDDEEWRILTNVHSGARAAFTVDAWGKLELQEFNRAPQLLDIERDYNEHRRLQRKHADMYTGGMPEATRREARRGSR